MLKFVGLEYGIMGNGERKKGMTCPGAPAIMIFFGPVADSEVDFLDVEIRLDSS